MADLTSLKARLTGCDATHRASKSDTHRTHGCIQPFCGFDGMLIASREAQRYENGTIQPLPAMANSISTSVGR